jgi:ankyrin repeat protein
VNAERLSSEQVAALQRRYSYLVNYVGDDPTAPIDPLTYRDSGGDSLLHIAAARGDCEAISLLLDAGVDPNLVGDMGYTPLHEAAANRQRAAADILVSRGAALDAINEFGKAPDLSAF